MWFTGYFLLATSTFCVALGFVPNQLPSVVHKIGIKPPCIYDSDESSDAIIHQQSSSTVKSGSSNISFNNGFDDVGYSKQSFSTKTSSTSTIQIEGDLDDSDSFQEFVDDIGDDVILSTSNMSSNSLTQSMSDLDILSGRSMGEGNLHGNLLTNNNEIISDIISSTMDEDITLSTVSDQINVTEMEDIIEEMTDITDTVTLSEIEDNLEASNLINNGPILPMHNTPTLIGHSPGMGDIFPPSMMKPTIPGSMMNSITPSQSTLNYLPKPLNITPPVEIPPVKPHQLHPTGYIPSTSDINSLPKLKPLPPGMGNQFKKPIPHLPEIPAIQPYSMPTPPMQKPYAPHHQLTPPSSLTPPMKKPHTPYQFPPPSMPTPPQKKPYGPYSPPSLMPSSLPKHSIPPYGGYPRTPRKNPFLPPQMLKPQMSYLPTTSETLTDSEYFMESWPQINDFKPKLPWQNNYFMPDINMPGMSIPDMNMPGKNLPGMNSLPYTPKYPYNKFTDFDETSEYFFNARNYDSLNSLYMKNLSVDYPYSQWNSLDSNYGLKYPHGPQLKKYPASMNTNCYPFERQEYPYIVPRNTYPNFSTPFWPYLGAPQLPSYQKYLPTSSNYPHLPSQIPDLPYSSFPKPKMPIPMNQPGNSLGEVDLQFQPQYPHSSTLGNYPQSLHPPKLPPGITPTSYPQSLHPPKVPPKIIPNSYPKLPYPPKLPPSGIIPGDHPKLPHPSILPPSGIITGGHPTLPHPSTLHPSGIIPGGHPTLPHPPKLLPSGITPGDYPKPMHPPKFPSNNIIPGPVNHPPSGAYPLDISYLIDQYPELYSHFDAVFVYSSPAALIAAKELSDAGKRVLLTSGGSYPPPESYSLYLRPQVLTQPNYVKRGPINIPGAFGPKEFFYPTFLGGISEVGCNNWDYGTKQKNQQWGDVSPAWNWRNIAQLYDSIELIPGEIDAEGIIAVNRNLPRTQTIEYISSALQDLGLSDLGTEYSLRDQPGSMMLPVMAEEGLAGLQAVVFAEEVLEDMNNPENVFLCLNTQIERIDVIGDRAIGVTIKTPSGHKHSILAEDIIMGGNPARITQLLYKAGLGDEMTLNQLGIPTKQHLPAVGKNWTVNAMFTGSFFTFPQGTLKEFGTSDMEAKEEFLQGQYGIQSGILLDQFKAFFSIQDGFESNVAINFYAFTESMVERLNALMEGLFQFDVATQMYMRDLLLTNDILFAMPQLMDTKSQGEVVINSQSDLNFPPTLDSGMYTNSQDMLVMQAALQFVESLGETSTFQMLGANYMQISVDACMGHRSFESYTECVICNLSVPGLHSSGGAIMGTNSLNSVVNENLQVHGMENLYIMNSAVIPNGGGVESVALDSLIGQYGAQYILQKKNLYL